MKLFHCDKDGCESKTEALQGTTWVVIGSNTGRDLYYENFDTKHANLIAISKSRNHHFCSQTCFIKKFFKPVKC